MCIDTCVPQLLTHATRTDPLMKTTTSLVANSAQSELASSIATALLMAVLIGVVQMLVFATFAHPIVQAMGGTGSPEMLTSAVSYIRVRTTSAYRNSVMRLDSGVRSGSRLRHCCSSQTASLEEEETQGRVYHAALQRSRLN
jgi:hypothetical protein